jgi:3-oxoacyl-[acyl-carrier-protein] synthase-1
LSALGIERIGAITPLGELRQTCAALRAKISRVAESEHYTCAAAQSESDEDPDEGERVLMATVPQISPTLEGRERLLALALHALQGLVGAGGLERDELRRSALLVALPDSDEAAAFGGLDELAAELSLRGGLEFASTEVRLAGHTGFFDLLSRAAEITQAHALDRCIVGGVDTYCSDERLLGLDASGRLRSSINHDGFIPGEAAVFFQLGPASPADMPSLGAHGRGIEAQTIDGELESSGRGLADCFRSVARGTPWRRVYCDMNGERYRAAEWGTSYVIAPELFAEDVMLVHPAEGVGDVGAASGALLLATAVVGMRRGYERAPEVLLWTSADGGERMAFTVRASPAAGPESAAATPSAA